MIAALVCAWAAACESPPGAIEQCDVATASRRVQAADRKIIGAGADYPADGTLRGREDQLGRSQFARRAAAWEVVARTLTPVALAEQPPAEVIGDVPLWQTWYGRDDISRLFRHLYEDLGTEGRKSRERFSEQAIDDAFGWNVRAVDELPNWPEDRWREYLEAITSDTEVAGVGGIGVVSFSPGATRHLLQSYSEILDCLEGGPPPAFGEGAPGGTRRMLREQVQLARCSQRTFGPFSVAGGETLRAAVEGAGAEVVVRASESSVEQCRSVGGDPCEVAGPGLFYVSVTSGVDVLSGALTIDYAEAEPTWAACLAGAFPLDAVVVKASWRRAQFGLLLPTWETSGAALDEILSPSDWEWDGGRGVWGAGHGQADPGPEQIYTLQTHGGSVYRLAGLHIMSKELDQWIWITLWWSPEPDVDFGADRPAAIAALGEPWRNYKMCVVTAFDERDPDREGGFGSSAPSLATALVASGWGEGGPTWCSNPYIERGEGNADTNCIGCHQHGGVDVRAEEILSNEADFPSRGRVQIRNNFPTDFSWAVTSADRLGVMFANVVEYYDSFE